MIKISSVIKIYMKYMRKPAAQTQEAVDIHLCHIAAILGGGWICYSFLWKQYGASPLTARRP